ncbi:MAG: hypothetical protein JST11_22875 [Acidobacteria bacterium]|nr:hypothetical protein [Acidobacteriota bacterium]
MSQPDWDVVVREIRDLQARVAQLEARMGLADVSQPPVEEAAPAAAAARVIEAPAHLLPVVGRALLGLAGAYLLRALTESGTFSVRAGVAIGLAYAMLWLVWAARTPAAKRLETAIHGLTSVLVLAPLLFEATSRFHAVSTWTSGLLLFGFTVFGFAVSWRKDLLIVATFATLAGLGTSGALLIATHDVVPFTYVFLAIAAAVEVSACLNHWLSERWLTATAADLVVLLATWLVTNERGLPESYAAIPHAALLGAQAALLGIYLASTIVRTLLRGFTFTLFETAQCAIAFAIALGGGMRLAATDAGVRESAAMLSLLCAAACYLVSFRVLDQNHVRGRNFYTYSTFGFLLALAGTRMLFSGAVAAAAWAILAIVCVWLGRVYDRFTLQVHGGIYLLVGLLVSGALEDASELLFGSRLWPVDPVWPILGGAATAAVCYLLAKHVHSVLRVAEAGVLIWLAGSIVAGLLTYCYHAAFGAGASHAYCATLRTAVLSLGALALAWVGARWSRAEFSRLVYPVMALGAWRVVAIDLQQDRTTALFLSLLLYGAALILLPRIISRGGRGGGEAGHERAAAASS